jgi:hypothetical protein
MQGLLEALAAAKAGCSDESLRRELTEELEEIEAEIADDRSELREAKARGKIDKVGKYEARIRQKESEAADILKELSGLD